MLIYLFRYAEADTGLINLDAKSFVEIQRALGITRQFMYTLSSLVKLGLLLKVTEAVHLYSGYRERGMMHYFFNLDMVMKPFR